MKKTFKIFTYSISLYMCAVSLCLSADNTTSKSEEQNIAVKAQQSSTAPKSAESDAAAKAPLAFFPEPNYQFDMLVEGSELVHDFVLVNKGNDTLKIDKVKTG